MVSNVDTKKNTGSRERSGAAVRDMIVSVATDYFATHGYPASTLRNIAEKAGITGAAIYYHFTNKEKILGEIIFKSLEDLAEKVKAAAEASEDPKEQLSLVATAHILYIFEQGREARIVTEDSRFLSPEDYAQSRQMQVEILKTYRNILLRTGLSKSEATLRAFNIISVVLGIYRWQRPSVPQDQAQILQRSVAFILRGAGL